MPHPPFAVTVDLVLMTVLGKGTGGKISATAVEAEPVRGH